MYHAFHILLKERFAGIPFGFRKLKSRDLPLRTSKTTLPWGSATHRKFGTAPTTDPLCRRFPGFAPCHSRQFTGEPSYDVVSLFFVGQGEVS